MCDVRTEVMEALKPFIARRNLMIVNDLYTRGPVRVMSIDAMKTDRGSAGGEHGGEDKRDADGTPGVAGALPVSSDATGRGVRMIIRRAHEVVGGDLSAMLGRR